MMMEDFGRGVYVIIGSSGEYSDRYERVIGYVLTEADAENAVLRAEADAKLPSPIPYPKYESTHGLRCEDGSWWEGHILDAPKGAKCVEKPNAAEIAARQKAAREAWRQARIDAGCIDPDGSMDRYYYDYAPAIAMEARRGETGSTDSTAEGGDSASGTDRPNDSE